MYIHSSGCLFCVPLHSLLFNISIFLRSWNLSGILFLVLFYCSSNIKYWKCFWSWAFLLRCFVLLDSLININLIDLSYFISIICLLLENLVELTHFAENRWHWNGFYCTSKKYISEACYLSVWPLWCYLFFHSEMLLFNRTSLLAENCDVLWTFLLNYLLLTWYFGYVLLV